MPFKKGYIPWNKGLTKETDERVLKRALKMKGRPSHLKGKKHSEEHIRKNRESHLGQKAWNKGIPRSQQTKDKISKTKTGVKGKPLSEEHKNKISIAQKGRPGRNKGGTRPPFADEWKRNISKSKIGLHSGKDNPNWRGGTSFEPYSHKFNKQLKNEIKKRDNNICMICENKERKGFYLHVHHIDYDKKNYNTFNLITLCPICHSKTNFNRKYWQMFFEDFMGFIYPFIPYQDRIMLRNPNGVCDHK